MRTAIRTLIGVMALRLVAGCAPPTAATIPRPTPPPPPPPPAADRVAPEPSPPPGYLGVAPQKSAWERAAAALRFDSYAQFCERQDRCVAVYDDEDVEDVEDAEVELGRLGCWSDIDTCVGAHRPPPVDTAEGVSPTLIEGEHRVEVFKLGSDLAGTTRWRCVLGLERPDGRWLVPLEEVCGGLLGPTVEAAHELRELGWLPNAAGARLWLRLRVVQRSWHPKFPPYREDVEFRPERDLVVVCDLAGPAPKCSAVVPVAYRSFDRDVYVEAQVSLDPHGLHVAHTTPAEDTDMESLFVGRLQADTATAPEP